MMISITQKLQGRISPSTSSLTGNVSGSACIGGTIGVPIKPADNYYEGSCTVIPEAFHVQELETRDKKMRENVIVREIPKESVSNEAGGYTVTIGGY